MKLSRLSWVPVVLLGILSLALPFVAPEVIMVMVVLMAIATALHSYARYGLRGAVLFFLIAWGVSHVSEAVSILTGFPFGHYHYQHLVGWRLFEVPITVMLSWYAMGYASWTLAGLLARSYGVHKHTILVPAIATFVMVMWNLVVDPAASSVAGLWVWEEGGTYFGVPLSNFFGWCIVSYAIFQLFALRAPKEREEKVGVLPMLTLYALQFVGVIARTVTAEGYRDVHDSLALIACFTMGFVLFLAFLSLRSRTLS